MISKRFEIVEVGNKFKVRDNTNEKFVAYSYSNPPMYEGESKCNYSEWGNLFAARGFAQKMEIKNAAR